MKLAFAVPSGMDLEDVYDLMARGVWKAVTGQPGFGTLYPGYFVSMRSIVRDFMGQKAAVIRAAPGGEAILTLDAPGDTFGNLGSELAAEIVCGLAELFLNAHCLDLITHEIPLSIEQSLAQLPAPLPLGPSRAFVAALPAGRANADADRA